GLDPIDTVDEFCRLFPHGDRRVNTTIRELAEIVASPSEYRDEFDHEDRRGSAGAVRPAPASAVWYAPLLQAGRALWVKIGSLVPQQARPGRSPRTSI